MLPLSGDDDTTRNFHFYHVPTDTRPSSTRTPISHKLLLLLLLLVYLMKRQRPQQGVHGPDPVINMNSQMVSEEKQGCAIGSALSKAALNAAEWLRRNLSVSQWKWRAERRAYPQPPKCCQIEIEVTLPDFRGDDVQCECQMFPCKHTPTNTQEANTAFGRVKR